MTPVCAYPRVKYIAKGMLSQKLISDNSHAFRVFVLGPQVSQISNRVDGFLFPL